eukprot:TRINITY_DN6421_c0_g5_i1.p1 TRINITY_DN6421_c0_g5~~TRINITY_DN6421_c0_g5_i1.p1  ORF type:complete len:864 (+),score=199.01 TRINITY_DN6421_c0_g5_i1:158-2749(+)
MPASSHAWESQPRANCVFRSPRCEADKPPPLTSLLPATAGAASSSAVTPRNERVLSAVHHQLRLLVELLDAEMPSSSSTACPPSSRCSNSAVKQHHAHFSGYQDVYDPNAAFVATVIKAEPIGFHVQGDLKAAQENGQAIAAVSGETQTPLPPLRLSALENSKGDSYGGQEVSLECPKEAHLALQEASAQDSNLLVVQEERDGEGSTSLGIKNLASPRTPRSSPRDVTGTGCRSIALKRQTQTAVSTSHARKSVQSTHTTTRARGKHEDQFLRLDANSVGYLTAADCAEVLCDCLHAEDVGLDDMLRDIIRHLNACWCSSRASSGEDILAIIEDRQEKAANQKKDCLYIDAFVYLMTTFEANGVDVSKNVSLLRRAFQKEAQQYFLKLNKLAVLEKEEQRREPEARGMIGLALDTVPASMIILNAVVIGVSADHDPNALHWELLEIYFLIFFSCEFLLKVFLFGSRVILCGRGRLWNFFDLFCICTALFDVALTYGSRAVSDDENQVKDLSGWMLIKMLRLARLARLVRLLRFKIFHELKMMVQGVVSGVRVLFWAIVLLFFCIFFLAILMRKLVGEQIPEFSSLSAAMFSLFRCFTDGCVAYNGTPLQERLRFDYGIVWMLSYILVFLFVTIGIFNLIMAIFIDNVVTAQLQRKQQALGENAERMEMRIHEVIAKRFEAAFTKPAKDEKISEGVPSGVTATLTHGVMSKINGGPSQQDIEERKMVAIEFLSGLDLEENVVTKDVFQTWLADPEVLDLLESIEVETSTKYELFDALDVDSGGELTVEELVSGLMRLRGPVSKTDVVATRLKVEYLSELIEDICKKLGIVVAQDRDDIANGDRIPTIRDLKQIANANAGYHALR